MDDMRFRIEIRKLLVDENYFSQYSWLNNFASNEIIIMELTKKIQKHPLLWKWFFKIC